MDINAIRNRPLNVQQLAEAFGVTLDTNEIIKWSLYDSNAYPATGVPTLTFFALPLGQGTGFGGGPKTLSDTNMQNQGALPAMQYFAVTDIEILVEPTTPDVTADMPSAYGAPQAANIVNDVWTLRRTGNLVFTIGQKPYLQEAPLWQFPTRENFEIWGALADADYPTSSQQSRDVIADVRGPVYTLGSTPVLLTPNMNFAVSLNWPEGLQPIVNPARLFVRLNGWLVRPAQ